LATFTSKQSEGMEPTNVNRKDPDPIFVTNIRPSSEDLVLIRGRRQSNSLISDF